MYEYMITDEKRTPIKPSLTVVNTTAASHFAGCVALAVSIINRDFSLEVPEGQELTYAIIQFIAQLHAHPFFSPQKTLDPQDPNYSTYREMSVFLAIPIGSKTKASFTTEFFKLLQKFEVPGIANIKINSKLDSQLACSAASKTGPKRMGTEQKKEKPKAKSDGCSPEQLVAESVSKLLGEQREGSIDREPAPPKEDLPQNKK